MIPMLDINESYIGRRVREIRTWRGMSLTAAAQLAGMSVGYLSMIERGLRPMNKRATLEALASALRVSASELTGQPYAPTDSVSNEAHAGITAVEAALDAFDLGTDPEVPVRPWAELAAAIQRLNDTFRAQADYAALGNAIPGLLAELHATYVRDQRRRQDVLIGLIYTYRAAAGVCKCLGARGLPLLAARLAQACAEELGAPEWIAFGTFVRGYAADALDRPHQYDMAMRAVDRLSGSLANPDAVQVAGALQLNAALVGAAQGNAERAKDHLGEAMGLAALLPEHRENFGWLYFGPENAGIWRVSLGTELGEGAKVAEYAKTVRPDAIRGNARKAAFYADLGRSLSAEKRTRQQGIQALTAAERIAPQLIRNNAFVRESVSTLLRQAQRDAAGRDLRGLAYRMGIAPTG
jgi:transcriptional regulator with XRE-family HTH domain